MEQCYRDWPWRLSLEGEGWSPIVLVLHNDRDDLRRQAVAAALRAGYHGRFVIIATRLSEVEAAHLIVNHRAERARVGPLTPCPIEARVEDDTGGAEGMAPQSPTYETSFEETLLHETIAQEDAAACEAARPTSATLMDAVEEGEPVVATVPDEMQATSSATLMDAEEGEVPIGAASLESLVDISSGEEASATAIEASMTEFDYSDEDADVASVASSQEVAPINWREMFADDPAYAQLAQLRGKRRRR